MPQIRSRRAKASALVAATGLLAGGLLAASPAPASPSAAPRSGDPVADSTLGRDNMPHPLAIATKREAQRQVALQRKLETGQAYKNVRAAKKSGDYVELERQGTDRIFVVLTEFGDQRYETATDKRFVDDEATRGFPLPDPQPTTFEGPLHGQIPEPDRSVDNSTLWGPDYSRDHFENMYFNRMAKYYEKQSSGRYSVEGDVTEWVKVPYNEALYGRGYCGDPAGSPVTTCASSKALIRDALAVWVQDQLDAGRTMTQIQDYLKTFDVQDRYDLDFDGNYDEPDGFIDHFQIVHAGGDEAAGDPVYGSDAIWSHRWYSNLQGGGPGGLPGVNIGANGGAFGLGADPANPVPNNPTGVWVGDYTIQPENGGLGVFSHEFGHDLGLPDLYDTSGNTGGAENNTAFWTLMSSGANIGDGKDTGIGDDPTDLGAWELFQLGWMDPVTESGGLQSTGPFYGVAKHGRTSKHRLGSNAPASTKGVQAVFSLLPDNEVDTVIGEPFEGEQMFYSGSGNDLDQSMANVSVTGTALTAKVNYAIEEHWDYAFLLATTDGGATWEPVMTNLSDPAANDQGDFNASGTGITGFSDGWVDLTATLPEGTNGIAFEYLTDAAVAESGFQVDNIAVDGTLVGTAETADEGWELDGFIRTDGSETTSYFNAYVLENRQYDGYDKSLKTAYNFGFLGTDTPDKVETYPYQDGMLVSYWNEEFPDNNVGDHPGGGLILPVDAHPAFSHWKDGTLMRPRIAAYDSTFGLQRTDAITLHLGGIAMKIASKPRKRTFDDSRSYWSNEDAHAATGEHDGRYQPGWYGVDVPDTGTTVRVMQKLDDGSLVVRVAPKQ